MSYLESTYINGSMPYKRGNRLVLMSSSTLNVRFGYEGFISYLLLGVYSSVISVRVSVICVQHSVTVTLASSHHTADTGH